MARDCIGLAQAVNFAIGLVIASAAAAAPVAPAGLERTTAKAVEPFARCFADSQDQAARAWWFVPKAHGGTFSNLGANNARDAYFLDVADRGATREIRLTPASAAIDRSVMRSVDNCI